ncbi:hypothetical protein AB0N62_40690 [Streptomyces sp. NPDC093982]|uniref:hypothetical protein n=1 Tax=Streptomyces sp. NPDC093982 TaxID=3155077 RepID=UPI003444B3A8
MWTTHRLMPETARAGVLAAAALVALTVTPAHAADGGDGIAGYQSAHNLLKTESLKETVSRFLVAAKPTGAAESADGGAGFGPQEAPNAAVAAPRFNLKAPVPMYEITPQFVTGNAESDPQKALQLSYLASRAVTSDGRKASVLLAPKDEAASAGGEGWQLSGIREGDEELTHAEDGTPQAPTFTEPQIHAWYRLTADGLVEPLNKEARAGLEGKASLPLVEYQKLVKKRYADKLPGSEYDRRGLAGGYADLTDADKHARSEKAEPAPPAQVSKTTQVKATEPSPSAAWHLPALGGAMGLIAIGGVLYVRRQRTAAEH